MTMIKRIVLIAFIPLALSACEGADRERIGTIGGAAVGAVAGKAIGGHGTSGTIGMILGAVAGGYLGGEIGQSLDNKDKNELSSATQRALNEGSVGQSYAWSNPDTGNRGTVSPTSTSYATAEGQNCRDFSTSVTLREGRSATSSGTACRQADGSWRVVRG